MSTAKTSLEITHVGKGVVAIRTLVPSWREYKLVQLLGKTTWKFFKNTNEVTM
jgi:hypothetical protein